MARMPGTAWAGPHHNNGRMSRYDIVCIHTLVGYAPAAAAHFSTKANGTIIQSRDTVYRSAANLNGNHRVISIENEDHGPAFGAWNTRDGHAVPGFTAQQIEACAQICAWAHRTHGIPLVACPDSRPGSRGIAYHRQGVDSPNNFAGYAYKGRVSGGETWTSSRGKVCPGDRRISQIPQIIARARQLVGLGGGTQPNPVEEDNVRNLVFGHEANSPRIWVGDGLTRRLIGDTVELAALQYWVKVRGGDPTINKGWVDLRVLGEDITGSGQVPGFVYKGGPSTADGAHPGVSSDSIIGRLKELEQAVVNSDGFLFRGGAATGDGDNPGVSKDSVHGRLKDLEKSVAEILEILKSKG